MQSTHCTSLFRAIGWRVAVRITTRGTQRPTINLFAKLQKHVNCFVNFTTKCNCNTTTTSCLFYKRKLILNKVQDV